jgi:hypothetical protein
MRNSNNFRPDPESAAGQTPADFFLVSLEAYANRIMVCLLDAGMPETEVWDAFRMATSTLNHAANEIDQEEFIAKRADINR